jgi:hypothetical protein
MRILLDENLPADFAALLVGHEASNVHSHGWVGIKNGELLRRAHGVCEVFVTLDRSVEFQQNIKIGHMGSWSCVAAPIALLTSRHTFRPFFWRPAKSAQAGL